MTQTDFRTRIKNLLAKAASTESQHEAEAFRIKAEELMVKWGISDAMLEAHDDTVKVANVIKRHMDFGGSYGKMQADLFAPLIARGLGSVRLVRSNTRLYLIGMTSDVDRAIEMIEVLMEQAEREMRRWWKGYRKEHAAYFQAVGSNEGFKARRGFLVGFAQRCSERLTELRDREQEDVEVSNALVLRSDVVDAAVAEFFPRLRDGRPSRMQGHRAGHYAGRKAGDRASLSGGRLAGAGVGAAITT